MIPQMKIYFVLSLIVLAVIGGLFTVMWAKCAKNEEGKTSCNIFDWFKHDDVISCISSYEPTGDEPKNPFLCMQCKCDCSGATNIFSNNFNDVSCSDWYKEITDKYGCMTNGRICNTNTFAFSIPAEIKNREFTQSDLDFFNCVYPVSNPLEKVEEIRGVGSSRFYLMVKSNLIETSESGRSCGVSDMGINSFKLKPEVQKVYISSGWDAPNMFINPNRGDGIPIVYLWDSPLVEYFDIGETREIVITGEDFYYPLDEDTGIEIEKNLGIPFSCGEDDIYGLNGLELKIKCDNEINIVPICIGKKYDICDGAYSIKLLNREGASYDTTSYSGYYLNKFSVTRNGFSTSGDRTDVIERTVEARNR